MARREVEPGRRLTDVMRKTIEIRGARENNLQNINIEIPRDSLTVVTGMSGSGKSSLAFETVYAEGQRRLMASMPTFARQFVAQLKKPSRQLISWSPLARNTAISEGRSSPPVRHSKLHERRSRIPNVF